MWACIFEARRQTAERTGAAKKTYREGQGGRDCRGLLHAAPSLSDQIAHLCRPAPPAKDKLPQRPDRIALVELKNWPVCQAGELPGANAVPMRNDYLRIAFAGRAVSRLVRVFLRRLRLDQRQSRPPGGWRRSIRSCSDGQGVQARTFESGLEVELVPVST